MYIFYKYNYVNICLFGVNFKCEFIIIMMLDFVLFIFVCCDVISFLFIGSWIRFIFGRCERYSLSFVFKLFENKV